MFSRISFRWIAALALIAVCGVAVAHNLLRTGPESNGLLNLVSSKQPRGATAYPSIDPSKPGATKWIKYPADDVLPHGIGIGVCDGVIVGVVSEDPDHPDYELMCTRYVVGDLDATDITMPLWRSFDFEMKKPDGTTAEVSVLRPLWWVEETGAKVGEAIDLGMHEIGISGMAKVLKIGPCEVDSRDNKKGSQIVTGKIKHHNAEVWDLVFNNDTSEPLGVTANHPIYSFDRDDWIPAGELRINEKVRTIDGTATLTSKSKRPGRHTVYNMEVHRSHSYHVSQFGILAHNSNILRCSIADGKFDYLFGRVTSGQHNTARSLENLAQMRRVGLWDDAASRAVVRSHLEDVAMDTTNIARRFTTEHGNFIVKESLFQGPSGKFVKFESTWEVLSDGTLRLTTVIPFGG